MTPNISHICQAAASVAGVDLEDIHGPLRNREYSRPRQIAFYVAREVTRHSYPQIGRSIGKRDHTTVMHGVRNIKALSGRDDQVAKQVEAVRRLAVTMAKATKFARPQDVIFKSSRGKTT